MTKPTCEYCYELEIELHDMEEDCVDLQEKLQEALEQLHLTKLELEQSEKALRLLKMRTHAAN